MPYPEKPRKKKFVTMTKDEYGDIIVKNYYEEQVGAIDEESGICRIKFYPDGDTFFDASCLREIANILDTVAKEKAIEQIPLTEREKAEALKTGTIREYKPWKKICFYPKVTLQKFPSYCAESLRDIAGKLDKIAKRSKR